MNMDAKIIKDTFESLTPEEITVANEAESTRAAKEHQEFSEAYTNGHCNICKRSLLVFSAEKPCLHYLLRMNGGFKKKHFKDIYGRWGYYNIATYLKWVSNIENFARNINNLEEEKNESKKFEYTIRWRHIEWTFSCAHTDFQGHFGTHGNFPHYHFQMRVDHRGFIDFTDFHIPFSEEDLFNFTAIESGYVSHTWGKGVGMQDLVDTLNQLPDAGLSYMQTAHDIDNAQFHVQTIINTPTTGEEIYELLEQSKKTKKTMSQLAKEKFGEEKIQVIISPIETIPDIAGRQRHNRQKSEK